MIPFITALFNNRAAREDAAASVAPTFVSLGTAAVAAGASVTPGLPAGRASGDMLVLFVQNDNADSASANNPADNAYPGWTLIGRSPGTSSGVSSARGTCYWAWSQDIASAPTLASTGDHTFAQIGCWRGVKVASPINVVGAGLNNTAASAITITPGITTTVANCLAVIFFVNNSDSVIPNPVTALTNANLTGLTIHGNSRTNQGSGGALVVADGVMATAGAIGNTTGTQDSVNSQRWVLFALEPI